MEDGSLNQENMGRSQIFCAALEDTWWLKHEHCGKKQCIFGQARFLKVFFFLGDVDYLCRFSGFRTKQLVKSTAFWGFLRILVNFDQRFREVYGF
jgi:hypothetical protein